MISELTPEQEALIPVYRNKWRAIALSTERIDRQKAAEAVKAAYAEIGFQEPHILFFDSPFSAFKTLLQLESQLRRPLVNQLWSLLEWELQNLLQSQLEDRLENQLWSQLWNVLHSRLWRQLGSVLLSQLQSQLGSQLWNSLYSQFNKSIVPEVWACYGSWYDFCISVLNCTHNKRKWEVFQSLVEDCGWILPFESVCYVCDRPIELSFDNQNRLHALCKPAIEYADGYSLYFYNGVTLPDKYGKIHPQQWQVKWILEEENAELRRVLIQGIGYARICQELQAIELDTWREYTLLRIEVGDDYFDEDGNGLPAYLLKMTCPSTGHIHFLRVPPDVNSAREAIRWVNWGIDPEEFAVQT